VAGLYRWRSIYFFIKKYILHKSSYNYLDIFRNYLNRLQEIEDKQHLYSEILNITCRMVSANEASLIIKEETGAFRICAVHGLAPFSIDTKEFEGFLKCLEKKRIIIMRNDIVSKKLYDSIKSEGLKYFVQSHAEVCVPLFWGESLYGMLNLGSRRRDNYNNETLTLLYFLADYFTGAIKRINLHQKLMRKKLELKQAGGLRSQILSNLSHELRTPLNGIIGLSELLIEGQVGPITPEQKIHLSMIMDSGRRLLNTLTNILDLSKIEANHLELNINRINVRRLILEVSQSIRFNEKTHFEVDIDESLAHAFGDEERLRLVFKHLLDNAAKFTKKGKVSVGTARCGEMLKIYIADTGIGIPEEKQDAIFESFCQADNGTARSYEGLGLGLAISKKIVELHGGRLWFASKLGFGSNFYITLPLKPIGVKHPEICLH